MLNRPLLAGTIVSHCRVLELLGGGGMGRLILDFRFLDW
jgi:hypothetical protein